jgi:coenzyme PQQ precursor peptide PqqA
MTWETPVLTEISCAMEVTSYTAGEDGSEDREVLV